MATVRRGILVTCPVGVVFLRRGGAGFFAAAAGPAFLEAPAAAAGVLSFLVDADLRIASSV
jgi:hypothetical protein